MAKNLSGRQRDDARRNIVIADLSVCYYCKSKGLKEEDKFCPNCGFPQRGTQYEMRKFLSEVNLKHRLLQDHKKAVNKARYILFGLSALNFIVAILLAVIVRINVISFISVLILSGIFLGLGLWSRKNPFSAILTGFFVYVVLQVIQALLNPQSIFNGIILKIIIISGFIYGFKGAKEASDLEEELNNIKQSKNFSDTDGEMSTMPN